MITTIEGNVKGLRPTTLGRLTLLVGPNGSGKSSVTQAIELALTGRPSDIAGKDPATASAIATLAPADATQLTVRLTEDNGATIGMSFVVGKQPPKPTIHGYNLPLRTFSEALSSSPAARRFFLQAIGGTVTWNDVTSRIPDGEDRRLFDTLIEVENGKRDPVGMLLEARERANRAMLDERNRVNANAAMVEQSGANLGAEPTDLQIAEARERVTNVPDNTAWTQAKAAIGVWSVKIENLTAQLNSMAATRGSETPEQLDQSVRRFDAALLLLDRLIQVDATSCGLCGQPRGTVNWLHRKDTVQRIAATKVQARKFVEVARELQEAQRSKAAWEGRLYDLGLEPTGNRLEAVNAYDTLVNLKGRYQQLRTARAAQAAAEINRDAWERVVRHIETVIGELLASARSSFITRVQRYLPASDVFGLQLDPLGFGLVRDGRLQTALSGAEWVRVTLAIALATTEGRPGFPILIPEDRAWDPATLADVMRALHKANPKAQIILTSTVHPKGKLSKDWTIVDFYDNKSDNKPGENEDAGTDAEAAGEHATGGTPEPAAVAPGEAPGATANSPAFDAASVAVVVATVLREGTNPNIAPSEFADALRRCVDKKAFPRIGHTMRNTVIEAGTAAGLWVLDGTTLRLERTVGDALQDAARGRDVAEVEVEAAPSADELRGHVERALKLLVELPVLRARSHGGKTGLEMQKALGAAIGLDLTAASADQLQWFATLVNGVFQLHADWLATNPQLDML